MKLWVLAIGFINDSQGHAIICDMKGNFKFNLAEDSLMTGNSSFVAAAFLN